MCEEARDRESSARKLLQSTNKSSQEEARRLDFHVMTCLVFMQCNVNENVVGGALTTVVMGLVLIKLS